MKLSQAHKDFITGIKEKVCKAQYDALSVVNAALIGLYWDIGKSSSEKQKGGWGKAIVPTLASELQKEFPGTSGFSAGNLWLMAQFYNEYCDDRNLVPLVREISWSKHLVILSKCKSHQERYFYTMASKKYGWTKNVLVHQIEN